MPRQLTAVFRRLGAAVRSFSLAQKTIAIIGVAVLVLGGIAVTAWLSAPSYAPLFSGLAASDASAVVDQLNADGVKYQLTDGGATIMVPKDQVYAERLKAASAGLPSSTTSGYDLLDKMGVTSSEFQQNVMYKQAMEEELANTIRAMDGVKNASVKLALPKDTVFTDQKVDPTASVFVQEDAGTTLDSDQVDAIVHLTSASIQDMKPTDVSVIDAKGNVLSAVGTGTTGSSDKLTDAYETKTEAAVTAMLDKIVGPGNSTVAVSATLSNQTSKKVSEEYAAPKKAPSLSESTKKEQYSGGAGQSAGVLGPDNIAVPSGTAAGNGKYSSTDTTKDNAVDKTTTTSDIPAGSVTRQTVSVAISKKAAKGLSTQNITNLVEAAVGYDKNRGDAVTVSTIGFSASQAQAAKQALAQAKQQADAQRLGGYIRDAAIAGGVIVALLLAYFLFFRRSGRREAVELPDDDIDEPPQISLPSTPVERAELEPAPTEPELPVGPDAARAQISTLVSRDPTKVAALLRGFMDEKDD